MSDKEYLGDGVYVQHVTNRVALEPPVFDALIEYQQRLTARRDAQEDPKR